MNLPLVKHIFLFKHEKELEITNSMICLIFYPLKYYNTLIPLECRQLNCF